MKEDKELLLIDLCARIPYGVKVCIKLPNHQEKIFEEQIGDLKEITRYGEYLVTSKGIDYRSLDLDIKPYLRPMLSMTEEERNELATTVLSQGSVIDYNEWGIDIPVPQNLSYEYLARIINWLNAHHFDYRELIDKDLAIEVTKNNNPY